MTVPAIIGAFFWKRGTSAGVLSSVIVGGLVVLALEFTTYKPFGLGSGVWGLVVSAVLFIGVSLMTKAPVQKANEFIGYIQSEMKDHIEPHTTIDLKNDKIS